MDELTGLDILARLPKLTPNGTSRNAMLQIARSSLACAIDLRNLMNPDDRIVIPCGENTSNTPPKRFIVAPKRELLKVGLSTFEARYLSEIYKHMREHNIRIGICMQDNFSFVVLNLNNSFVVVEPAESNVYSFAHGTQIPDKLPNTLRSYESQVNPYISFTDIDNIDLEFFQYILDFEKFAEDAIKTLNAFPEDLQKKFKDIATTPTQREKTTRYFNFLCNQIFLGSIPKDKVNASLCTSDQAWHCNNIAELKSKKGDWLLIADDDNFPWLIICTDDNPLSPQYFNCIGAYYHVSDKEPIDFHILAASQNVDLSLAPLVQFIQSDIPVGAKLYTILNKMGL